MFFIILMNCCLALAPFFSKYALLYVHPLVLVALRMLGAGVILCGSQLLFNRQAFKHRFDWSLLIANGLITMCLLCVFEAWALKGITSTQVNLMWATLPLFIAFALGWWYKHPLHLSQQRAIALGTIGIICLIVPEIIFQDSGFHSLWHTLSMLAAISAATCGYLCTAQLAKSHPVILSNGISMCIGGTASLILSYLFEGRSCFSCTNWPAALGYIGLIVVIVNVIGLTLQMWLTRKYSVVVLALSGCIAPLAGTFFGFIQGDTWNVWMLIAALFIGSALALLHYSHLTSYAKKG
jgi:drug/metabolite transporter (DMT)-like permease